MAGTFVGLQMRPASKECEHISESRTSIKFPTSLMSSRGIQKPSLRTFILFSVFYLLLFVTPPPLPCPLTYENEILGGSHPRNQKEIVKTCKWKIQTAPAKQKTSSSWSTRVELHIAGKILGVPYERTGEWVRVFTSWVSSMQCNLLLLPLSGEIFVLKNTRMYNIKYFLGVVRFRDNILLHVYLLYFLRFFTGFY